MRLYNYFYVILPFWALSEGLPFAVANETDPENWLAGWLAGCAFAKSAAAAANALPDAIHR